MRCGQQSKAGQGRSLTAEVEQCAFFAHCICMEQVWVKVWGSCSQIAPDIPDFAQFYIPRKQKIDPVKGQIFIHYQRVKDFDLWSG